MNFQQADEQFRKLKARYEAGEITKSEFKAQLEDLMVEDAEGGWWMIGYETEKWYHHSGKEWVQEDPPGYTAPRPAPSTQSVPPPVSQVEEEAKRARAAFQQQRQAAMQAQAEHKTGKTFVGSEPVAGKTAPAGTGLPKWLLPTGAVIGLCLLGVFLLSRLNFRLPPATPASFATEPPATQAPATEAPTQAPAATPAADASIDCRGAARGDAVSLLVFNSQNYPNALEGILQPLVDACGIVLQPEYNNDAGVLSARDQAGNPPDLAITYAAQLQSSVSTRYTMDSLGADPSAYVPGTLDPGVVDGSWIGLPVNTHLLSLVWYSPANFQALGLSVPASWEELEATMDKLVATGYIPWSMGLESGDASGWTAAHFIQDILLAQQGPDYVNGLLRGDISYDDFGVQQAYETYARWARDPQYAAGGVDGTLQTSFLDALDLPFTDPPGAMLVRQGDWALSTIAGQFPDLQFGSGYDFFLFPGGRGLIGASDFLEAFSNKPAVQAVVAYLSSPAGGAAWARASLDLSPNMGAWGSYTDPFLIQEADGFYKTPRVTPPLAESLPGDFYATEWMMILDYLKGGDLGADLKTLTDAQYRALGK